jgi:hypothetical protein
MSVVWGRNPRPLYFFHFVVAASYPRCKMRVTSEFTNHHAHGVVCLVDCLWIRLYGPYYIVIDDIEI